MKYYQTAIDKAFDRNITFSKILFAALFLFSAFYSPSSASLPDERLRQRLEIHATENKNTYYNFPALSELYENWQYELQWVSSRGTLNRAGDILFEALSNAHYLGLNPNDYHLTQINSLRQNKAKDEKGFSIDLELLLSDALVLFLKHSYSGRVNSKAVFPEWFTKSDKIEVLPLLHDRISATRLQQLLKQSEPQSGEYQRLKTHLRRLIDKPRNSDKAFSPLTRVYKIGDSHPTIGLAKQFLADIYPTFSHDNSDSFDESFRQQLYFFQAEHNLKNDGVLGPASYWLLQQQSFGDIDTVRVNLERWRWMPRSHPTDYVSVNIPSFTLELIQGSQTTLTMDAIIGRNYRMTPVMEEQIRYVVLNPSWFVPHKIASNDLLKKIQANPNYFDDIGMEVLQGVGNEQRVIDTMSIAWNTVNSANFPYRLRQKPGPKNALGKVKFIFPNDNNVYLHDTNDPSLFSQSERSFSSGCIRIAKPMELLFALFDGHPTISREKIQSLLDTSKETTVYLQNPLTVRIHYWTVWVDEEGKTHYRNDLYQRDKRILDKLNSPIR